MISIVLYNLFLTFIKINKHCIFPSSSSRSNDGKVLFTNSGIAQFKDLYKKKISRMYSLSTMQKCFRAGGKKNDFHIIGKTYIHHTYFIMLGNFTFNKYVIHNTIFHIYDFLFNVIKFQYIYITMFYVNISQYVLLKKIFKINNACIVRNNNLNNFWEIGNNDICGISIEFFFDNKNIFFNRYRVCELWNLVFAKYKKAKLNAIKSIKHFIDTGMGFERMCNYVQRNISNYKICIFMRKAIYLIHIANILSNTCTIYTFCDHMRALHYLLNDNINISSKNAGYIIKKFIKRVSNLIFNLRHKTFFTYLTVNFLLINYQCFKLKFKIVFYYHIKKVQGQDIINKNLGLLFLFLKIRSKYLLYIKCFSSINNTYGIQLNIIKHFIYYKENIIRLETELNRC